MDKKPMPDFQREAEKSIDPNPLYNYLITQQQYEFAEQVRLISLASQMSAGEVEELREQVRKLRDGVEELVKNLEELPEPSMIPVFIFKITDDAKQLLKETEG